MISFCFFEFEKENSRQRKEKLKSGKFYSVDFSGAKDGRSL
jgi:hypothetical protein